MRKEVALCRHYIQIGSGYPTCYIQIGSGYPTCYIQIGSGYPTCYTRGSLVGRKGTIKGTRP